MTAPAPQPAGDPLTGSRSTALTVYVGLSGFFLLVIYAAFYFAGSGVFGLDGHAVKDASVLDVHRVIGEMVAGIVVLLMLVAAIVARPGPTVLWGTVLVFVLTVVGQPIFAGVGEDHRWVGGLHVLNGGVILVVALLLHLAARRVPRT